PRLRTGTRRRQRPRRDPDGATGVSSEKLEMRAGESANVLLREAAVLDPVAGIDARHDVVVRDGVVAELAAPGTAAADGLEEIDAGALQPFPPFFAPPGPLRPPGQEHREDIEPGPRSPPAGGYCGVLAMANTEPPVSTPADLEALLAAARSSASVRTG